MNHLFNYFLPRERFWLDVKLINERYKQECLGSTLKHGGKYVTEWGCFQQWKLETIFREEGMMDSVIKVCESRDIAHDTLR